MIQYNPLIVCLPRQNSPILTWQPGLPRSVTWFSRRICKERELPNNKFGYDEVEQAMAMMWHLDFGKPLEEDIKAALALHQNVAIGLARFSAFFL